MALIDTIAKHADESGKFPLPSYKQAMGILEYPWSNQAFKRELKDLSRPGRGCALVSLDSHRVPRDRSSGMAKSPRQYYVIVLPWVRDFLQELNENGPIVLEPGADCVGIIESRFGPGSWPTYKRLVELGQLSCFEAPEAQNGTLTLTLAKG